jgi:YjbE family integral membrane protein
MIAAALGPDFWEGLWKIIIADIILAGDNAVVIALAVRSLPERQQFFGRMFGAFGAVVLRVLFVWIVTWLLKVPYLQVVGGAALIWIAYKLVRDQASPTEDVEVNAGASLWQAIWIIVVADVVMSFDNVMAISAASMDDSGRTHMGLVIIGLLLSIPLVIFGSGLLSHLMKRFPVLVWLGAGLLGHVAAEMILNDNDVRAALGVETAEMLEHRLPFLLGAIIAGIGWWLSWRAASRRERGEQRLEEIEGTEK